MKYTSPLWRIAISPGRESRWSLLSKKKVFPFAAITRLLSATETVIYRNVFETLKYRFTAE